MKISPADLYLISAQSLPVTNYLCLVSCPSTFSKIIVENRLGETYVFSSFQSASVNPFCDGSCDLFQRADSKQLRLMILVSNLAQVVDRRAFTD